MRTFELQKDLPDCPSKEIYKQTEDGEHYVCYNNMGKWSGAYPKEIVENNPTWFKEIKDTEESSKPFVWTDELVLNFAIYTRHDSPLFQGRYKDLEDFKKLNASIPAGKGTANDVLNEKWFDEQWKATDKPATEETVTVTLTEKDHFIREGKDWEIMEMRSKNGGRYGAILDRDNDWDVFLNNKNYHIHSVKRLSDGEVFSVKDDTQFGIIKSFRIYEESGIMEVHFEDGSGTSFQSIEHKISKPQPQQESKRRIEVSVQIIDQFGSTVLIRPMRSDDKIPVHKANQIKIAVETIINS